METPKLTIQKQRPIPMKNRPKNAYKIHLEFMFGDADHFDKQSFVCESDLEFEFFYRIYKALYKKRPSEVDAFGILKPIIDEYIDTDLEHIKDYIEDGAEEWIDGMIMEWPYDMPCDCSTSLWNLEVTYFDENGNEFEVTVKEK